MCGKGEWVGESIYVICAVMSWGLALCSVLQGGRCSKNIGLQYFHPYEPSSKTLGFVIFFSHLRSFFLRSFSSWRAVVEVAISISFRRVAHFSAFASAACWISKILFDLDPLRTRHCPSLAWLVVLSWSLNWSGHPELSDLVPARHWPLLMLHTVPEQKLNTVS